MPAEERLDAQTGNQVPCHAVRVDPQRDGRLEGNERPVAEAQNLRGELQRRRAEEVPLRIRPLGPRCPGLGAQVGSVAVLRHPRAQRLHRVEARERGKQHPARRPRPAARDGRIRLLRGALRGEIRGDFPGRGRGRGGGRAGREERLLGDRVGAVAGLPVALRERLAAHDRLVGLPQVRCLLREEPLDPRRATADPGDAPCHIGVVVDVALEVLQERPEAQDGHRMLTAARRADEVPRGADLAEGGFRVDGAAHADRAPLVREAVAALAGVVGSPPQSVDLPRQQPREEPERIDPALEERDGEQKTALCIRARATLFVQKRVQGARHVADRVSGRVRLAPEGAAVALGVKPQHLLVEPLPVVPGRLPVPAGRTRATRCAHDFVSVLQQISFDRFVHCSSFLSRWRRE